MSQPFVSTADAVEALTILVESQGVDLTANYSDWLRIAFALADEFGLDGEPYFHRLSAFYPKYTHDETTRQYHHCLQNKTASNHPRVTIATLFYIASQHGITLNPSPNSSTPPVEELEEFEEKPHTFSQSILTNLPLIMQRIVADSHSDEDADILILGSLAVFSACLPNVYGVYDRRPVHPNLFLFVTAPASAGKGRLSLCRHLAAPLHQSLRDKYKRDTQKYDEELAAYNINKKTTMGVPPKQPPFLTLFVPANSTATVVYQTLSENDGVGLLFETEGDTLANAFKSDLGDYSDGFRKAFHHETISYLRKKDHEFVEILRPKFSAVLSGTRQQVYNLIPDAENGLFSRFIFYAMPTELVWRDMFPVIDGATADERFRQIGRDFYAFLKEFPKCDVQFTLSRDQKRLFNDFFAETQLHFANTFGDDIVASVRRLGLILFRIAMIFSVLRLMDAFPMVSGKGRSTPLTEVKKSKCIVCSDIDFQSAMSIVKVLLQHTADVFQSLPRHSHERQAPKGSRQLAEAMRSRFLAALPATFDRPTYIAVAATLGITDKTAERYIREFCATAQLNHPSNGLYQKSNNS